MKIQKELRIQSLTISHHLNLVRNLEAFWLSKVDFVRPLHHPIFSLLFTDFCFVLLNKSEPVSYIYAAHNNRKGFIHIIATKPEFYNQGFASILLEHLEKKARLKQLRSLWAYTLPENNRSVLFFKKNGFILRKKIQLGTDDFRILYKKEL